MNLPARLDSALVARLYPSTDLGPKQLAHALGISDDTLWRYRTGRTSMPAEVLIALIDFFRSRGDRGFETEVMDGIASRSWWLTERGEVCPAGDLAESALALQGLPESVDGDHVAAVKRNLGWVSLSLADAFVTVGSHERGLSLKAQNRAERLLLERQSSIAGVKRSVDIEDRDGKRRTVAAPVESVPEAIRSLRQAMALAHLPAPLPWTVEALKPRDLPNSLQRDCDWLLECEPREAVPLAMKHGRLSKCSMLSVSGVNVRPLFIGENIPPLQGMRESLVGREVSGRADVRYGEVVHAGAIDCNRRGFAVARLKGQIQGRPSDYYRIARACGNGLVLVIPVGARAA